MTGLFRTTVVEISGVRTIAGGGTNASNATQALLNLSGVSLVGNQTISGNINISGAFATSRSRTFVYSGATRGPAARSGTGPFTWNNIAYGANCRFTPRHRGTIKAEASVGLTVPSQTADTIQAATFWYGTGTPPVFSGNLNDLNNINRIGGIKGVPQASTTPTLQLSPIGASWVSEVTGLTTGTSYWFDIAMSGRFLFVQDVQIYLEEIY